MDFINFTPYNPLKTKIKQTLIKNLVLNSVSQIENLKHNKFLKLVDWKAVHDQSGVTELVADQMNQLDPMIELEEKKAFGGEPFSEPLTDGTVNN